jgi:hypothetical protein
MPGQHAAYIAGQQGLQDMMSPQLLVTQHVCMELLPLHKMQVLPKNPGCTPCCYQKVIACYP